MMSVRAWSYFAAIDTHLDQGRCECEPSRKNNFKRRSEKKALSIPKRHSGHRKYNNARKQKAINTARMIPSLLFFAPIRPIKLLMPGTWLATPTTLRLILAKVSLCAPKLSLTA